MRHNQPECLEIGTNQVRPNFRRQTNELRDLDEWIAFQRFANLEFGIVLFSYRGLNGTKSSP
jgi:hypothetical protein